MFFQTMERPMMLPCLKTIIGTGPCGYLAISTVNNLLQRITRLNWISSRLFSHHLSQSFSQTYGPNLPTSLTYVVSDSPEFSNLGHLMRFIVRTNKKFILCRREPATILLQLLDFDLNFQGSLRIHKVNRKVFTLIYSDTFNKN